jgi:hypothetical protein
MKRKFTRAGRLVANMLSAGFLYEKPPRSTYDGLLVWKTVGYYHAPVTHVSVAALTMDVVNVYYGFV